MKLYPIETDFKLDGGVFGWCQKPLEQNQSSR
jgi:hypothetical protein